MSNPYDFMASGKTCDEVLQSLASSSDADLTAAAAAVTDEQLPWVLSFVDKTVKATGVRKAIIDGAVLHAASFIEDRPSRRELIDCLYEDQGVSRSEGYRCIQIWLAFGAQLIAEPRLQKHFCEASLAILSEKRTSVAAREEALRIAQEGEKITMKRAKTLQSKYGVVPELSGGEEKSTEPVRPCTLKKRGPKPNKWHFVGSAARIEIIPTAPEDLCDVEAVICDLQAAIDQLREVGASQWVA